MNGDGDGDGAGAGTEVEASERTHDGDGNGRRWGGNEVGDQMTNKRRWERGRVLLPNRPHAEGGRLSADKTDRQLRSHRGG